MGKDNVAVAHGGVAHERIVIGGLYGRENNASRGRIARKSRPPIEWENQETWVSNTAAVPYSTGLINTRISDTNLPGRTSDGANVPGASGLVEPRIATAAGIPKSPRSNLRSR
jgi:hypothetical protein